MRTRVLVLVCASITALSLAGTAGASQLIARNASHTKLAVNSKGTAMVTYSVRGKVTHLLAWGAVNARPRPKSPRVRQVEFKLDYSGGWKHHRLTWKHFKNRCRPYDGPGLAWLVAACKAPNGSYWALQSWQTALPDLGLAPWLAQQRTWWLHLSHWTGPLAKLDAYTDWIYGGRFQEVFGRYSYNGQGVRGFGTTRVGAPTDNYGRLLFLDTFNSAYGKGWLRENSFVSHGPPGMFCYGFYRRNPWVGGYAHPRWTPNRKRPTGVGEQYRITAAGPGVTPDVMWQGPGLHPFNRGNPADVALESSMNAERNSIRAGYRKCSHD
ncbi:MAG TPA: hypothetical protein VLD13_04595 [Gaiellaceae bacterium]|nr:hypothetical protein [Gaiellaceae bacterium]